MIVCTSKAKAELLLNHDAELEPEGIVPLLFVAMRNRRSQERVELLLRRGANANRCFDFKGAKNVSTTEDIPSVTLHNDQNAEGGRGRRRKESKPPQSVSSFLLSYEKHTSFFFLPPVFWSASASENG